MPYLLLLSCIGVKGSICKKNIDFLLLRCSILVDLEIKRNKKLFSGFSKQLLVNKWSRFRLCPFKAIL